MMYRVIDFEFKTRFVSAILGGFPNSNPSAMAVYSKGGLRSWKIGQREWSSGVPLGQISLAILVCSIGVCCKRPM